MAKEEEKKEIDNSKIVSVPISAEMKKSYLDYAMSVITARALPDVRDGLKPVHRRILFSMYGMGLMPNAKTRKSAAVVGDVIGKYHPHGEAAVYEAMVRLAQPFSMRYPLIIGQGNFGSIDGDPAAAQRYTEAKISKIGLETLKDLEKDTVDWRPNFENTRQEPELLPSVIPNLLLNGTLGIAVGMASNIPTHNLGEISEALVYLIDNPHATTEDLLQFVKGPDFPTGGMAFNARDIQNAYTHGRGGVVVRGEAEIIEEKSGNFQIVITSIPFRVLKSDLISKIAELHHEKKIEGIKGLRDESTDDIKIVVDLKSGAHPQQVLNYLYKHTQLEEAFHYNMVVLVDGVPQTLSLKRILEEFVKHRKTVVVRRTKFDLAQAEDREHILLGLKKALDHIDEIVKLIKSSPDTSTAHANLRKKFGFSDRQATAILEMKLQKLAGLERKKIEDELEEIQIIIQQLKALLASEKKIFEVIKKEIGEVSKYSDPRRTKIYKNAVTNINVEDLIPDEDSVLVLTKGGYIKRTDPDEYHKQKRGGVGVIDIDTKEEDFVTILLNASAHSDLLYFTNKGKVYQTKMYEIPEGRRATRGKSIMNFLPLVDGEVVTSILPVSKDKKQMKLSVFMITRDGVAKRVDAESFKDVRRNGIIAITLKTGDELISANFTQPGDSMILVTKKGQSIRFKESDIREMGRSASGVRAIKIGSSDKVISANAVSKDSKGATLLVFSENGYGKQSEIEEYKIQNRGGSGIKTAKVTQKIGNLISAAVIFLEESEIVAISKKGQVIRIDTKEIPVLGRQTQGVRVMKLRDGDSLASLVCF